MMIIINNSNNNNNHIDINNIDRSAIQLLINYNQKRKAHVNFVLFCFSTCCARLKKNQLIKVRQA